MLPALTVGRLDAKVRLQKWEKVGEIRCGPQARAANETAGCGRTEGVSRHFALVIGSEGTPVDACKASGGSCRFVCGKSHGDEASRRLSGVVSGTRLGGKAQGAGEAAVFGARLRALCSRQRRRSGAGPCRQDSDSLRTQAWASTSSCGTEARLRRVNARRSRPSLMRRTSRSDCEEFSGRSGWFRLHRL